jgi:CBS domain-containing protein
MHHCRSMKAGELCVRDVVTAEPGDSAGEVAKRMADHNVGNVIVVVQRPAGLPRPIGIVTDRDLVVRLLARSLPASTPIVEVMQRDLVSAFDDDDVEHVVAKMRAHGIRRVPIIDRGGGLQGMLSLDDVLGWMRDELDAAASVTDRQGRALHMDR